MSATRSKKYPGVFRVEGRKGVSYGIDYIDPQTGHRVRKIVKGATSEAKAADARNIEIADIRRGLYNKAYGIPASGRPLLFSDAAALYLENWSAGNKNLRTDKQRMGALLRAFGGKLLSNITAFSIERFKLTESKRVARVTVNKYLSLGAQVIEKMRTWKKYEGPNPFLEVERYRVSKGKKPGCLTPDEVGAILAEIGHQTKRAMVLFAYHTGWRVSEITHLRWDEVDIERGLAWLVEPKNKQTVEIPLSDAAVAVIRAQERRGAFVFCHLNGAPYKTGLHSGFIAAAKRAGVVLPPRKAWHILRRTWATMFLQAGGDVETLRTLGNWRDHAMPLWYAEAAGADLKRETLNKIPKPDGRKMAEIQKADDLTG